MYWTDGAYSVTVNGVPQFQDANPALNIPVGTYWTAAWANNVTNEMINLVQASGQTPDASDQTQITKAVQGWAGKNVAVFTPSGATVNGATLSGWTNGGNFTVPSNVTRIKYRIWGGGAAGNGSASANYAGGGGGGGGYTEGFATVTPGQTIAVTVGATATNGAAGNTSSLGTIASATGGQTGTAGTSSGGGAGGAGGLGIGGQINMYGTEGGLSTPLSTTFLSLGQGGGAFGATDTLFGVQAIGTPGNAPDGAFPGGGGAGSNGGTPGTGAPGQIVLEW